MAALSAQIKKPPLPKDARNSIQKLELDRLAAPSSIGQRAARRQIEQEKENSGSGYKVPAVNETFKPGSLQELLNKDDESVRRHILADRASNKSRRPLSSKNPANRAFVHDARSSGPRSNISLSRASQISAVSRVPELAPF